MKDPSARPAPVHGEPDRPPDQVTGLLLWPNETDSFTPEPDLGRNIWFARDVPAMAQALDTEPVLIVAQAHELDEWPCPRRRAPNLPNNHLEYAITWFSPRGVWAGMTVLWIRTELRGGGAPARSRPPLAGPGGTRPARAPSMRHATRNPADMPPRNSQPDADARHRPRTPEWTLFRLWDVPGHRRQRGFRATRAC